MKVLEVIRHQFQPNQTRYGPVVVTGDPTPREPKITVEFTLLEFAMLVDYYAKQSRFAVAGSPWHQLRQNLLLAAMDADIEVEEGIDV
jgi:hypothetical protein